jgi:acyl-coenzyme A synthetase/AMP-(fatty) acid ligase
MNSLGGLAQGGSVVLMPRFTAQSYIEAAVRYKVKSLTAVPTMIALMLRERQLLETSDLSSVEQVRIASAPLTQALIDSARAIFPTAVIVNGYGTTEGGAVTFGPHPDGITRPEISVGYPLPTVEWRLMRDGEQVDDEGALEIRSGMTMSGYYNLPDATANAITEDGFYRTKDVFRRDDQGFFYFVGRSDDMFVCGGENIYPGEVEMVLEKHPDIQQASVVPVPDPIKGHKPVAFVVATPGAAISEEHVKAFALAAAPAYQHPRRVYFLDELPLAGTNKIDRHALLRLALAPLSAGEAP